ncbi:hypothetical protein FD12_GL001304 [Lentilactobacillus rapi DSM 19907 = JCM 15042]|uniref:Uncharacterized protein n=2 Tax=Lentilactobacillus rapi TaxID=481723 RepID=A0A512PNB8_9LACO|nr:DUF2207 domain-containing protein [Lentilactobacillus rapi]KRL17922.1 hypothetical protein FD12_GL001304 [Lentilactobacillus rapi DSM 19907 = JCM 15042]GEP72684.1 hypothetical protein LRA02_15520 [Lentilactobacillus rapi]
MRILVTAASIISLIFCLGAMAFLATGNNSVAFILLMIGLVMMIVNIFFSRSVNKPKR